MNGQFQRDEHGIFFSCGICAEYFDDKDGADKCCSRLIAQADPTEGRLPPKRSKQQDAQMAIPDNGVLFGHKKYMGGLR